MRYWICDRSKIDQTKLYSLITIPEDRQAARLFVDMPNFVTNR